MSDAIDRLEIEVSGGDTKKVEDGLNALAKSLEALRRATTPVSYTHLDVYKRQTRNSSKLRNT